MKRIRRRAKRSNSSRSPRRTVSYPSERPGLHDESGDESGSSSEVETSEDLETGCPTKEKPKRVTIASDIGHKKNDDRHNKNDWKAHFLVAMANLRQRLYQLQQRLWDQWSVFVHGVPLLIKVALVLHGLVCVYVISIVYAYYFDHYGTLGAVVLATCTTLALLFTASVTVATSHTATMELAQLMDQQIKSRAILNTLYPTRVLEQMYLEVTPEQMEQAQHQVLNHLDSAAAAEEQPQQRQLMSDESILFHEEELEEDALRLQQERRESYHNSLDSLLERTASSRSLGETTLHTRNQGANFSRRGEIDPQTLEYDNDDDLPTPSPPARPNNHNHKPATSQVDRMDVFCVKRNSLNMRRLSMTRRASLAQQSQEQQRQRRGTMSFSPARRRDSSAGSTASSTTSGGRPIQERFEPTTVLLADIAGFTSWCSEREPTQVFHLLESVFFVFDNLAKQLNVYKIETIGDCYVAVTGIPDFMEDHCCAMALFASQIVIEFDHVVEELAGDEDSGGLGRDTAALRLRVGCHSGPVTAGVLRGDKGRFQLFGDTVNTAARMESNGQAGRVQISEQMANVLAWEGKSHWYTPREDKITAKGKGELETYWLQDDLMGQYRRDRDKPQPRKQYVTPLWRHLDDVNNIQVQQLTEWNFQQLEILVKKIVAMNMAHQKTSGVSMTDDSDGALHYEEPDGTILDELEMDANVSSNLIPACNMRNTKYESVVLSPKVVLELLAFVKAFATNFQNNPFHNFQHSCHMIRSMIILMDELNRSGSSGKACNVLAQDPLAQFVVILTCMVQDVDNPGVTNEQLMQEDSDMAEYFNRTCLQQQNALDVAWELLVGEKCENLLQAICSHSAMELERFRKYMVHAMMATDREDRDLLLARFKRWKEVSNPRHGTNRSNSGPPSWLQSIVSMEQFVQLSNQIHNAQTPEFFAQWNERCFREQYLAYISGRREQDPCEHYYATLVHLFRKTIVPLTERYSSTSGKKKNNGMLGKCEELSQQAKRNMEAWERDGETTVRQLATAAKYEFGEKQAL